MNAPIQRKVFVLDTSPGHGGGVHLLLTFPEGTSDEEADLYVRLNDKMMRQVTGREAGSGNMSEAETARRALARLRRAIR